MRKPFGLAAAVLASFTTGLMGCAKTESAAIPPSVEVLQVVQKDVPITREWVATLDGLVNAQIRAQVSGILLRQNYTDGAFLRKGTPLFEIDPRPFQAALDQATADLRQAEANLQRGQAELGKTEQDVARYTPLAKESAISQQELDDAVQANLAAKAQVEQQKAAIESARATVESARLNLSFTKILSPLDGIAAIATAQVGDFVGPQSGSLTTVSTVDPILATITPSEQEYLSSVRYIRQQGDSENTALRKLDWQLKLSDGTEFPYKGKFYAIDRQVDIRTGAIRVQIQFPNPGNVLRPGGFGSVSTVTRVLRGALLIPQRAVSELQGGFLVATVDQENRAHIRSVEMGSKIGGWWIVDEGLKPGDRIVVEGVQKVRDGLIVTPKNYQETPSESAVVQQGNRS
jgi:RND family efflux transporter MFP subunit